MPKFIKCTKCGAEWNVNYLYQKETYFCILCSEPLPEMMTLDKATWEEGDLSKGKDEGA